MNQSTDTSRAAWRDAQETMPSKKRRILAYVEKSGKEGATCEEIEIWLSMSHQSCSSTITHLKQEGWLVDSGNRRLTRSNSYAAVYVLGDGTEACKTLSWKDRLERALRALQAVDAAEREGFDELYEAVVLAREVLALESRLISRMK